MLEEDADRERYEVYSAQCLWTIASGVYGIGGTKLDLPQYVELAYPEMQDKQSAKEIKDHILNRLLEG